MSRSWEKDGRDRSQRPSEKRWYQLESKRIDASCPAILAGMAFEACAERGRLGSHDKTELKLLFRKEAKSQTVQYFFYISQKCSFWSCWQAIQDLESQNNMTRFVFLKDDSKDTRELNHQIEDRGRLL